MKNDPTGEREEEFNERKNVGLINPFNKIVSQYKETEVYNQPKKSSSCGPYALANILPNLGRPEEIISQMEEGGFYSSKRGTNLSKIIKYLQSQGYSSAFAGQEIKSDELEPFFQQVAKRGDVVLVGVRKYYDPSYRSSSGVLGHLVSPQGTFHVNEKLYVVVIDPHPYSNSELERMEKQDIFKIDNLLFVPAQAFVNNLHAEGGTKAVLLIRSEQKRQEKYIN